MLTTWHSPSGLEQSQMRVLLYNGLSAKDGVIQLESLHGFTLKFQSFFPSCVAISRRASTAHIKHVQSFALFLRPRCLDTLFFCTGTTKWHPPNVNFEKQKLQSRECHFHQLEENPCTYTEKEVPSSSGRRPACALTPLFASMHMINSTRSKAKLKLVFGKQGGIAIFYSPPPFNSVCCML
jgi:hypothetical protein